MPYHAVEEKETGDPAEAATVAAEATKKPKDGPTVCIVGDGNAAHVLIPFLGDTHHTVNLMSLNPAKWERTIRCDWKNMNNEVIKTFVGDINKLSDDFADVIPDADIIFLVSIDCTETVVLFVSFLIMLNHDFSTSVCQFISIGMLLGSWLRTLIGPRRRSLWELSMGENKERSEHILCGTSLILSDPDFIRLCLFSTNLSDKRASIGVSKGEKMSNFTACFWAHVL